jgi:exodeoxyribonuclease VII large subunit
MIESQLEKQTSREVLTVSEINRRCKRVLESQFPLIWVSGEVSNFVCPSSGHWYFTLKDSSAQIHCAMFRNRNMRLRFEPKSGDQVIARARVSLYEGRGDYQLIIDHLEPAGDGLLQRAYNELKAKLSAEGLFDQHYKSPLPELARHIGVITSPSGAAIRDIITVLKRRFPSIAISIFPVSVQGNTASGEISRAIALANQQALDLLIVGRGGGSLEDLQAFNSEEVARSIFASKLPVVSAVGHEIDFTIADFVADLRAPTPSAAAELVSPDQFEWQQTLLGYQRSLAKNILNRLHNENKHLHALSRRLRHPGTRLREQHQRLDDLEIHLFNALRNRLSIFEKRLSILRNRMLNRSPLNAIHSQQTQVHNLRHRLTQSAQHVLQSRREQFGKNVQLLETVSPLATLNRGYAIVQDNKDNILRDAQKVKRGDRIKARLGKGSLHCTVNSIES